MSLLEVARYAGLEFKKGTFKYDFVFACGEKFLI